LSEYPVQAALELSLIRSSQQICVGAGEEARVQLGRDGVGGYVWSIGQLPPGLVLVAEPERVLEHDNVGGGAVLEIRLKADAPGHYVVVFELKRLWGNNDVTERRKVTVEVR
jgi:predicted secreted protein